MGPDQRVLVLIRGFIDMTNGKSAPPFWRRGQHFCGFAGVVGQKANPLRADPLRDLRHCGRRRQERHSISAATPSSITTMTPSPMIASLVRRFMIKPYDGKTGESEPQKMKGPGEGNPGAFAAF
jgi:hypothetical protein